MSETFTHEASDIPFLHVYARPSTPEKQRPLEFIRAAESGPEGIACVDDVARAALLALQVYEATPSRAVLQTARAWLDFVIYMQEPDGRFVNFIRDRAGRKNRIGRTSYAGGQWWTSRALWALAAGWRVTGDDRYLRLFERGRLAPVRDLKITAVQALALMELYVAHPSERLRLRICALCDRLLKHGPEYLRDRAGVDMIKPWGYHQLHALARAARLFQRPDYLAACERTVQRVIEPLVAGAFSLVEPSERAPQCAYDVSTIMLGLAELHHATNKEQYRALALACAGWLYGANPSGEALYDPHTGCCADGLSDDKRSLNVNCGAESTIEAGFMELARRRLAAEHAPRALVAPLAAVLG
ncbi:MAG TPA: hypothetical protein VHB98_04330 [Chloroflexota bacterium]|nr:hypothetical protein [Chloroflexota bacterium]